MVAPDSLQPRQQVATAQRLPPRAPPARGAFLAALPPTFLASAACCAAFSCLAFFMRSFTSLHQISNKRCVRQEHAIPNALSATDIKWESSAVP